MIEKIERIKEEIASLKNRLNIQDSRNSYLTQCDYEFENHDNTLPLCKRLTGTLYNLLDEEFKDKNYKIAPDLNMVERYVENELWEAVNNLDKDFEISDKAID